jgi:hypothetical protein
MPNSRTPRKGEGDDEGDEEEQAWTMQFWVGTLATLIGSPCMTRVPGPSSGVNAAVV